MAVLRYVRGEPALLVTSAYLVASMIGLWCSFWFYRQFDIPILSYLQASDLLFAAFRDPVYLGAMLALGLIAWLLNWPSFYWRKHARQVDAFRERRWGRLVFAKAWDPFAPVKVYAWTPETAVAFAIVWGGAFALTGYVTSKAEHIQSGGGDAVSIVMATASSDASRGDARLLGTSSQYVFLWWPQTHRAEVVPIEAIARIGIALPASRARESASTSLTAATPVTLRRGASNRHSTDEATTPTQPIEPTP